jgi:hypothetical protein
LTEKQHLVKLNIGIEANPKCIKVNAQLTKEKTKEFRFYSRSSKMYLLGLIRI